MKSNALTMTLISFNQKQTNKKQQQLQQKKKKRKNKQNV